jgi:hypothetical protein
MHSYMKAVNHIRFRCSDYPSCKTYLKLYEVAFEIINAEMISNELSIEQFISRVKGKPTWEALYLANEEATAAERLIIRSKSIEGKQRKKITEYIGKLADFMQFLKSSIKIPRTNKKANLLFWAYWDSIN